MKMVAALLAMVCLLFPSNGHAAEHGIYIAPKFVAAVQHTSFRDAHTNIPLRAAIGHLADVSMNKAVAGGAFALGYDFSVAHGLPLRFELEYSIFGSISKKQETRWQYTGLPMGSLWNMEGKTRIQSLFMNAYYDFKNSTWLTPYVGAGLGLGFVHTTASLSNREFNASGIILGSGLDGSLRGKTRTNFAWNIGLGCAYAFNETVALDLGYRYAQFGKGHTQTYFFMDGSSIQGESRHNAIHQFLLSARMTF